MLGAIFRVKSETSEVLHERQWQIHFSPIRPADPSQYTTQLEENPITGKIDPRIVVMCDCLSKHWIKK